MEGLPVSIKGENRWPGQRPKSSLGPKDPRTLARWPASSKLLHSHRGDPLWPCPVVLSTCVREASGLRTPWGPSSQGQKGLTDLSTISSVIHAEPSARAQSGSGAVSPQFTRAPAPPPIHTESVRTKGAPDLGQLREVTHEAVWWLAGKAHLLVIRRLEQEEELGRKESCREE